MNISKSVLLLQYYSWLVHEIMQDVQSADHLNHCQLRGNQLNVARRRKIRVLINHRHHLSS